MQNEHHVTQPPIVLPLQEGVFEEVVNDAGDMPLPIVQHCNPLLHNTSTGGN